MKYFVSKDVKEFLDATVLNVTHKITDISVVGEAGCGKTEMVRRAIAEPLNLPFYRMVCSRDMAMSDFLIEKTAKDGTVYEKTQRFCEMLQIPSVILVDEYMLAPADVMGGLNSLLDQDRSIELPNKQVIKRHPDNIIVMCSNPSSYAGAKKQHGGFVDRMPTLEMTYSPNEYEIIKDRFNGIDETIVVQLTTFAEHIRNAKKSASSLTLSTRGLLLMAQMMSNGATWQTAVRAVVRPKADELEAVNQVAALIFGAKLEPAKRGSKGVLDIHTKLKTENEELAAALQKIREKVKEIDSGYQAMEKNVEAVSKAYKKGRIESSVNATKQFISLYTKALANGEDISKWFDNKPKL